MKRMERLERAVGEIQRELRELNGFAPSQGLDLTHKKPVDEYVQVLTSMQQDLAAINEATKKWMAEEVEI